MGSKLVRLIEKIGYLVLTEAQELDNCRIFNAIEIYGNEKPINYLHRLQYNLLLLIY